MAPPSLALALVLSLALSAPALADPDLAEDEVKETEEIKKIKKASSGKPKSTPDGTAKSGKDEALKKKADYDDQAKLKRALKDKEAQELKKRKSQEKQTAGALDSPGGPASQSLLRDVRSQLEGAGAQEASGAASVPASVEGESGGVTAAPTEQSLRAQQEAARGMSRSTSRAMGAASRAASGLKQAMPEFGDTGGGGTGRPGEFLKGAAGRPDPNADLAMAKGGAHGQTMRSMGLDVRTGPDGRAHVVRENGAPASAFEVAELRRKLAAEPEAVSRHPSFFQIISRQQYSQLKNAYGTPAARAAFQDVGLSAGARDFLWSRSCSSVSGSCNPHAHASHYKKGDYVPPTDLRSIWAEGVAPDADESHDDWEEDFAESEYTEEEEKEADAAIQSMAAMASRTSGLTAKLGELFGGAREAFSALTGGEPAAASSDGGGVVLASAVGAAAPSSIPAARRQAVFAYGSAAAEAGKERSPSGSSRTGSRSKLTSLLVVFGALLLAAGLALRKR